MSSSFLGQEMQQKRKKKQVRATTVFPIQLNTTWSVHLAWGQRGELWLPGERERAKRGTVTQGSTWFVVCSQSSAPLCSLLVRICDKTICWPFLKAIFCLHICGWRIYFNRGGEHMQLSLNLFCRKRTRIYLGKNWIYILNKPKSLIKFLFIP